MDKFFAGIDVSTQSIKIIILNFGDQSIVYKDSLNYDEELPKYQTINGIIKNNKSSVSESDPLMWIDAVKIVLDKVKKRTNLLPKIKALSVSGQQHGLVSLDKNGKLSRSTSKLWNDFSTQDECDILTEKLGGVEKMISEIANTQRVGYTASKIFHMYRNERNSYMKTHSFLLVHNFINWYLSVGKIIMEEGDASGTGLWDPVKKNWSKKIMNIISKDLEKKLPQVKSSIQSIGTISSYFVEKYGFDPNCKIGAGSGDNMYSAIGTGNIEPGIVSISLGTSGTAYTILKKPYVDLSGDIACFCDSTGHYMSLLCISNMAGVYNTFLKENNLSHTEFEDLLSFTSPGNNGNIIVPWYDGERTPDLPEGSPIYFGFSLKDLNLKSLARGIMEGPILNLYEGFERMPVKSKKINITGGLSVSKSWCQTIADIFNCKTVSIKDEGAALGAAIHAGWVWEQELGHTSDLKELVNSFIKINEDVSFYPKKDNKKVFDDVKLLYKSVSRRIRGLKGNNPFIIRKKIIDNN